MSANRKDTVKEETKMEAHNHSGDSVRIEQVIAVGIVGNKNFMQETAIKEGSKDILHVVGHATEHVSIKSKTEGQRPTIYIKGAFEATNLLTKQTHISGQLILPDSASGYVTTKMDMAGPVSIDITIRLERAEKSIVGYKFAAILKQLTPTKQPQNTPIDTPQDAA